MYLDITAHNQAPVEAATSRLILAQRKQRFAFHVISELRSDHSNVPGWIRNNYTVEQAYAMQSDAFKETTQARAMLAWCEREGIKDIPITDHASLKLRAQQRAQVEREYHVCNASNT